jgi:hypothetical protein
MVKDGGQLYTIEGVAAALIMLTTAYLVVGATAVYTPGDAHISDMQLEILGSDALRMMDAPPNFTDAKSPIRQIIEADDGPSFWLLFNNTVNNKTGSFPDHIHFTANYSYRVPSDNSINSSFINASRNLTGGEHAVRVTKWVIVTKKLPPSAALATDRAVLVEVLLWRD